MGNFEKLSVLVIVVIIVMILVVAIYEWTGSPSEGTPTTEQASVGSEHVSQPGLVHRDSFTPPTPTPTPTPGPGPVRTSTDNRNPLDISWPIDGELIPPTPAPAPTPDPAPAPAPTPGVTEIPETTHVVVAGDTLGEISKKHYQKASLYTRIMDANPGVSPETLRVGTKLKIPALRIESAATPATPGELAQSGDRPIPGKDYKVRRGDTWEKISKVAFNTTERWPEIYMKNINKVSRRDELRPDLVIAIPN